MHKIFISYSSNDKPWVSKLANELINQGYDVWWDLKLLPGQQFEEVIRGALNDAKCVVTVWSESSLQSVWVQEESNKALERGILIPILYQKVTPPMPFGRIHTGDLTKWCGKADDPAFQQLLQSIDLHTELTVKPIPHRSKKKISVKLISILVLLFMIFSISVLNVHLKESEKSIFLNIFNENIEKGSVKEKAINNDQEGVGKNNKTGSILELSTLLDNISGGKFTINQFKCAITILKYESVNFGGSDEDHRCIKEFEKYKLLEADPKFYKNDTKIASFKIRRSSLGDYVYPLIEDQLLTKENYVSNFDFTVFKNINNSLKGLTKDELLYFIQFNNREGKGYSGMSQDHPNKEKIAKKTKNIINNGLMKFHLKDEGSHPLIYESTPLGTEVYSQIIYIMKNKLNLK